MRLLVCTCLCLYLLASLLDHTLRLWDNTDWSILTPKNWTSWFSQKFINAINLMNLKNLSPTIKEPEIMQLNITNNDLSKMSQIEKWQFFLNKKHNELERAYYGIVDEATQKLSDMKGINPNYIPDLTLYEFTFVKEWNKGDVDSQHVLTILRTFGDFKKTATDRLTRKLHNYALRKTSHESYDMLVAVENLLIEKVVPIYITYLTMLRVYMEKCAEIDRKQEKISWIEQFFQKDSTKSELSVIDYNINQALRQLEFHVEPYNTNRYLVGKNMIVFDEDLGQGRRSCHWICGPSSYITEISKKFQVKEIIDLKEEHEYIENIIGVFVK